MGKVPDGGGCLLIIFLYKYERPTSCVSAPDASERRRQGRVGAPNGPQVPPSRPVPPPPKANLSLRSRRGEASHAAAVNGNLKQATAKLDPNPVSIHASLTRYRFPFALGGVERILSKVGSRPPVTMGLATDANFSRSINNVPND